MSPRPTWLHTRSTELRAALLDLGLTITDTEAHKILDDKLTEYATLMRVTRQTAQNDFTDERLIAFAQSLARSLSDEAPGADLIEFERTISMPVAAVGLTTAALAEALKVAHINLDDKEAVAGLSLLSTLGMITADANDSVVPTPRPLLLRIARYLDGAAASITLGANLPDGLDDTHRQHFADILAQDADGIRPSPTPKTATLRHCGAPPTHDDRRGANRSPRAENLRDGSPADRPGVATGGAFAIPVGDRVMPPPKIYVPPTLVTSLRTVTAT